MSVKIAIFRDTAKSKPANGSARANTVVADSAFAGRRTFICFALASGIPPQVVMKWTGHSDYQSMKPYIEIAEKAKAYAHCRFP